MSHRGIIIPLCPLHKTGDDMDPMLSASPVGRKVIMQLAVHRAGLQSHLIRRNTLPDAFSMVSIWHFSSRLIYLNNALAEGKC